MTLYEIVQELENFEFEIDEETGEILNADALDQLELDKSVKIENICLKIKNLRAEEKAYKEEKNSFAKREKAAKTQADNLFNYLQNMLAGENFKSSRVSVTYRSSKSVECDDISKVPVHYLRQKDPDIDKVAIKKAIEDGNEVAGCRLVVNQNMQIK